MGLVKKSYTKGVIVTMDGRVDQLVKWESHMRKDHRQDIILRNEKGDETGRIKRRLVSDLDGFIDAKSRWDFDAQKWSNPTELYGVVDTRTMSLTRASLEWPDALPEMPEPYAFVDVPLPPKSTWERGRKFVYNDATDAWEYPRKVAIMDASGEVVSVALEHPSGNMPDVTLPAGCSRFDDRDWPINDDGEKVAIGHIKKGKDKWCKKPKAKAV